MLESSPRSSVDRFERNAGRLKEIVGVAARYGFAEWIKVPGFDAILKQVAEPETLEMSQGERLRRALTELGPTFIKAGQVLSTRVDLIGPELAEELAKLQADTPPDPPELVAETILLELGQPVEKLFASFEPEAFASASIAQVHRATLWTGEEVAVKVQRQGLQEKVEADFAILEKIAGMAEKHSTSMADLGLVRLVKEFERTIMHDLDFRREIKNIETFRENFRDDFSVAFPVTWPEFSSQRVLTMSFMPGILGTDIEALKASGEDLNSFAYRGAHVYLDMVFRDGFYHADPHPGNLKLLPNGAVGILDFGMVGRIDPALNEELENLVLAITEGNVESLTTSLWSGRKGESDAGREELRSDLNDLLLDSGGSIEDIDVAATLNGMLTIFRKYRITTRPGLSMLLRTIVLLEGTSRRLSPQFSLNGLLRPYHEKAMLRRLNPKERLKRLQKAFVEWDRLLEILPGELLSTVKRAQAGEFRVALEHRHLDAVVNRLVLGIITAALILGASQLWSMNAPPLVNGRSILGGVGFGIAMLLGWLLYRAVKESGKVAPRD